MRRMRDAGDDGTRGRGRLGRRVLVACLALAAAWVPGCGQGSGGGDAGAAAPAAARPVAAPEPARVRNVVLVSIDTLRADRLQPYGYARETSPNLMALARRSVVFDQALAQSSQTAPSHAALFTSQYGGTHGIINVHGSQAEAHKLPPGLSTLAGVLKGSGLATAAFVCGGNLTRHMGMDRGFAQWDEKNEDVRLRVDAALSWLDAHSPEPFFLLVHSYQVHAPYVPPKELADRFTDRKYSGPLRARYERYAQLSAEEAWAGGVGADYWEDMVDFTDQDVRFLSDLYDGEIAYSDGVLRDLFQRVLTGPLAANTALVVLADHGEEFRDHGKFQHDQVFQELLHVPLMVHLPPALERAGWTGRVSQPVELIDVAPTIADLFGVDWRGAGWQGRSLLRALDPATRAGALQEDASCFAELVVAPGPKTYESVMQGGWKYIHCHQQDLDKTWEWLFDLRVDPKEQHSLVETPTPEAAGKLGELKDLLAKRRARDAELARGAGEAEIGEVDAAWRENLNQLGYVGTGSSDGRPKTSDSGPKNR
jgi:arylsulfatase A-like enzyme